jgi:hypothetical protein
MLTSVAYVRRIFGMLRATGRSSAAAALAPLPLLPKQLESITSYLLGCAQYLAVRTRYLGVKI